MLQRADTRARRKERGGPSSVNGVFVLGAITEFDGGFTPASSHATSSSRDCSGVISIWSRAIKIRMGRRPNAPGNIADNAVRKNEQVRMISSCGHAVSSGGRLDFAEEKPNPVEQTAEWRRHPTV